MFKTTSGFSSRQWGKWNTSLYTVSVCLFIAGTLNYVPGFLKTNHRNFWEVRLHAEERWSVEQHGSAEKLQEVDGALNQSSAKFE